MSGADLGTLLEVATAAARAGIAELVTRSGTNLLVETKTSATDPVTEADRAAEAAVVATIRAGRPDDGLLGEEGADATSTTGYRWVVDPLDGTVNFLYGHVGWGTSVACEVRDGGEWIPVVGAVIDGVRGEIFSAVRGGGATRDGVALAVTDPVGLSHALVATGFAYDAGVRSRQANLVAGVLPRVRDIRRVGSAALDLCAVAAGRLDGYYEDSLSRWDYAAGALIAVEAGAVVTPLPMPDGSGAGVVAAGPALHRDLVALLGSLP